MSKHTAKQIQEAVKEFGVELSDDEAQKLIDGTNVDLDQARIKSTSGRCEGIRIKDLGDGCGLYYIPPFQISYCCEF